MLTRLELAAYRDEIAERPPSGRHLLAQYDDNCVVVYQAYRPSIAAFAVEHGFFGGEAFSFSRMSWIKTSFLWMMFRCGWATKEGQERVLAIRVTRASFDALLARVVPSSWDAALHDSREAWQRELERSDVRLQWDPDHEPSGEPVERRTIQLGLRGDALAGFRGDAIASIEDVTPFVAEQRAHHHALDQLRVPVERAYPVDEHARARLGLAITDAGR